MAIFRDVLHAAATCKALLKSILDTETHLVKRLAAGPKAEFKFKRETREMYFVQLEHTGTSRIRLRKNSS